MHAFSWPAPGCAERIQSRIDQPRKEVPSPKSKAPAKLPVRRPQFQTLYPAAHLSAKCMNAGAISSARPGEKVVQAAIIPLITMHEQNHSAAGLVSGRPAMTPLGSPI